MKKDTILVTGANGQLGSELTTALKDLFGEEQVIATDIVQPQEASEGPFELLDIQDAERFSALVDKYQVTQIYHLAAILSARGEQNPVQAWDINMNGLLNVLNLAKEKSLKKIYWPSSIAVFGPTTPCDNTPQKTVMEPNTVYGISKLSGELWCQYYFEKFGVDVRSLRYPGLIGYKALPGGGTTDYAVDIYHKAIEGKELECFLSEDSYLPMMYMPDAVRATLELMEAEADKISVHTSYNLGALSFSPKEIYEEIKKHYPDFSIRYQPDFRQAIADTWPNSVDDQQARDDWDWKPEYDLAAMTQDMLDNLKKLKTVSV
ncbi:NAD-dependent epimerase/dehydratase family protein [Rapidithrix thailandica]|uniref:NAD-dependent epimerase/dehydratase family protein n=1 Tax=Rapidithrix thailandica TaxID=413964 RepID=A0AAW9SF27_9BACT